MLKDQSAARVNARRFFQGLTLRIGGPCVKQHRAHPRAPQKLKCSKIRARMGDIRAESAISGCRLTHPGYEARINAGVDLLIAATARVAVPWCVRLHSS